jgi:hypothetical protein
MKILLASRNGYGYRQFSFHPPSTRSKKSKSSELCSVHCHLLPTKLYITHNTKYENFQGKMGRVWLNGKHEENKFSSHINQPRAKNQHSGGPHGPTGILSGDLNKQKMREIVAFTKVQTNIQLCSKGFVLLIISIMR